MPLSDRTVVVSSVECEIYFDRPETGMVERSRPAAASVIRVVDESAEDYLFSATRFVPVEVPAAVKASLLKAS